MIQVDLIGSRFNVVFSQKNDFGYKRDYDSIQIEYTKNSRVYCTAIKDGIKYCTIAKKMQFDDEGNVYLSFGKSKVVIGTYTEQN